jgi:hypothetical protein
MTAATTNAYRLMSQYKFEMKSLSRGNGLTTTQARQLEVASRHLYACLIEFTNPRVFQTENEEDEEKDAATLETLEKPDEIRGGEATVSRLTIPDLLLLLIRFQFISMLDQFLKINVLC